MAHQTPIRNPFLLMLNPEVVLAAVENSERLGRLNRHLCRPLDKPTASTAAPRLNDMAADDDESLDLLDDSADGAPQ